MSGRTHRSANAGAGHHLRIGGGGPAKRPARLGTVLTPLALAAVMLFAQAGAASTTISSHGRRAAQFRPAQYVGAHALDWSQANRVLGPMRSDKVFYPASQPLPPRWPKNSYGVSRGALAIVAYKVPTKNVLSFVRSIPRNHEVTMVFWQEPEAHVSASWFRSEFEAQARLIHSAHRSNVTIAYDASTYRYQRWDRSAYDCQYVPPRHYADYYFGDVYEQNDQSLRRLPWFERWVHCTAHHGRARGLAEYGLGSCQGTFVRMETMLGDASYLGRHFPYLHVLSYWWDQRKSTSCHTDWQFTDPGTINAWREIEAAQPRPRQRLHRQ
jgi:hypothetical protein